jgi:hypothetical protein
VYSDSLLSKPKLPALPPASAIAIPLLATVPLSQPCTSEVISTSTNWFKLDFDTATGLPPLAETPRDGAVLNVSKFSGQGCSIS